MEQKANITTIETMDDFNKLMEVSNHKLAVIDFYAQWWWVDCCPYIKLTSHVNHVDVEHFLSVFFWFNRRISLYIIDCKLTFSGPCKWIGPIFEKMAEEYPDAVLAKCDVEEAEEVAEHCQVSAMPTFVFYRNGKMVEQILGANEKDIRKILDNHKEEELASWDVLFIIKQA